MIPDPCLIIKNPVIDPKWSSKTLSPDKRNMEKEEDEQRTLSITNQMFIVEASYIGYIEAM